MIRIVLTLCAVFGLLDLVGACARHVLPVPAPTPAALDRPLRLQTCPDAVPIPVAPPPVRTVPQLAAYAQAEEDARARTEAARSECAARLAELNDWINRRVVR